VPADDELPLGEDVIGLVSEPGQAADPAPAAAGDADWIATQASDRPEPARQAPAEPEPAAEEEPARKPAKKRGRASVPSWDEIMFGGGKGE
jgi:hypothetical protein